jgi:hypothetical protein
MIIPIYKMKLLAFIRETEGVYCAVLTECALRKRWLHSKNVPFSLGVFGKMRKAFLSFIMSVSPPVCPHATQLPHDEFSWNVGVFRKSVQNIQVLLKSDKNIGYFT